LIMTKAKLIITHDDPDLDAIGFVYTAKKVFGPEIPVECRKPTRQELENPHVIVGDIGLPGSEDIGHNPTLNNFDHHFSSADRSATFLVNDHYHALRWDIVEYIDAVDIAGSVQETDISLKVIVVGIRVKHYKEDLIILKKGGQVLEWLEEEGQNPGDITGTIPNFVREYLDIGQEVLDRIQEELATMQIFTTIQGRSVGYLVTHSTVFSVVKEAMFAEGLDIVVVYSPMKDRYSIASNVSQPDWADLIEAGLRDKLNTAEIAKGGSQKCDWGGHADRLGSPKSTRSLLTVDEILNIIITTL
jgi:hypothetical protein